LKSLLENEEKKNANQLANNKSYINKPPISNYNSNNVKDVMSNKENLHKDFKGHTKNFLFFIFFYLVEKPSYPPNIIEKTRSISVDLNPNSSRNFLFTLRKDLKIILEEARKKI